MQKKIWRPLIITIMTFFYCNVSDAIVITYEKIDIENTLFGQDLWEYKYTVSDVSFTADTGFTIYFDLGLYDLLDPYPVAPNADWDVITWNPDSDIHDDGAYDAYALVDNASLTGIFSVKFIWLGSYEGPAEQKYDVYDGNTWQILNSGETISRSTPVPEPGSIILLSIGLISTILYRFSKKIIFY